MIDLHQVLTLFIEQNGGRENLADILEWEAISGRPYRKIKKKKKARMKWMTQKDVYFLIENYSKFTNRELAIQLNRSYISICNAVYHLRKLGVIKIARLDKQFDLSHWGK